MEVQQETVGKVGDRIRQAAFRLLDNAPDGMRYSELASAIQSENQSFNSNTINGSIWNLDTAYPERVYKPSRGLFRAVKYKSAEHSVEEAAQQPTAAQRVLEESFYAPFADWLVNEIEDATKAISLGRNVFKDKWGTPDVIGKYESKLSDIVKAPTEIISAEIKTDTQQLVTAFGQACAYKIFSHKSYLVVPQSSPDEELDRLDALCQIFSIGLVTFCADAPSKPDFRILVRPQRHEPDLFYTNKYLRLIENELFR